MPRSRKEDAAFREWLATHTPVWTEAARRPGPRLGEPGEVYCTTPARSPSAEGHRIIWVHSSAKAGRDDAARMARADIALERIAHDAASDGCFPLITCDRDLSDANVLGAYRYQPNLERRHHLLNSVHDAAPALLHSPGEPSISSGRSWHLSH